MSSSVIRDLCARGMLAAALTAALDAAARAPLDRSYAGAMAKVHAQAPEHDDIATLYAEALMDLLPWDL